MTFAEHPKSPIDSHQYCYVQTNIGVHYKFMRWDSFMAVSAAIMSDCDEMEDAIFWYERACKGGIVYG